MNQANTWSRPVSLTMVERLRIFVASLKHLHSGSWIGLTGLEPRQADRAGSCDSGDRRGATPCPVGISRAAEVVWAPLVMLAAPSFLCLGCLNQVPAPNGSVIGGHSEVCAGWRENGFCLICHKPVVLEQ